MVGVMDALEQQMEEAVALYWLTRKGQRERQMVRGTANAGLRSAVTGGSIRFWIHSAVRGRQR
jgi:hypothetical protein